MQVANLLNAFLMVIVLWNSFLAGVLYNKADISGSYSKAAFGRMLVSVLLCVFITFNTWR